MRTITKQSVFIFLLATSFYFYQFLLQVSPSVLKPVLFSRFGLTHGKYGMLAAAFFCCYALMQIPVGVLLDRFGARSLLFFSCLVCVIGVFIFGNIHVFWVACLGRILIGLGASFVTVSVMFLNTTWFPPRYFGTMTGLLLTIGMLGAICGQAPVAYLFAHVSFEWGFNLIAIVGIGLAILQGLFIRNAPKATEEVPRAGELAETVSLLSGLGFILKKRQAWIAAIYGGCVYALLPLLAGLWAIPFFEVHYHLSTTLASVVNACIFIGWAIGAPLSGVVSEKMQRRIPALYIGSIGSLITTALMIYVPMPTVLLGIVVFVFGLSNSFFLPAFSMIREITPKQYTASALGFMNLMNMIMLPLLQPLVGVLLDWYPHATLMAPLRAHGVDAYTFALSVCPLLMIVTTALVPLLKETWGTDDRGRWLKA